MQMNFIRWIFVVIVTVCAAIGSYQLKCSTWQSKWSGNATGKRDSEYGIWWFRKSGTALDNEFTSQLNAMRCWILLTFEVFIELLFQIAQVKEGCVFLPHFTLKLSHVLMQISAMIIILSERFKRYSKREKIAMFDDGFFMIVHYLLLVPI